MSAMPGRGAAGGLARGARRARSVDPDTVAYLVLLACAALDATGYSVLTPVAPAIARRTGAGPGVIGALVGSFPVGMLGGFAIAGVVARRFGTRSLLAAALAVVAVTAAGFAFATTLPGYFATRIVMGVGSGGLWIGITLATLERWPGQEYLCMSRIYAAYSVGGLLGPALGAIGGVRGPFLAYVAATLAGLVLLRLLRPPCAAAELRPDRAALRSGRFWLAAAGIGFAILGAGVAEGVLPLHFAGRLGQAQIAALYVGLAATVAVASTAAAKTRASRVLGIGAALMVAGIAAAGATGGPLPWVLALAAAGLGIGAAQTGATGVLLDAVPSDRIVTAMIVWSQLGMMGYLVGPVAGGAVAETFGFGWLGLVPAAAAAVLAAVALAAYRSGPAARRAPR